MVRSLSPSDRMAMALHLPCVRARIFLSGQRRQESRSRRAARPAAVGTIYRRRYRREMVSAARLAVAVSVIYRMRCSRDDEVTWAREASWSRTDTSQLLLG